jgi:xylulose-5-phosphate/fructose-6-phosphate phosphoketolase
MVVATIPVETGPVGVANGHDALNLHGNINTPLELAIRNETDRFSLAMDAIDRIPRVRVSAAGLRDELANQRIACEQHAYRFGIDRPDITAWKWPF